MSKTKFNGFEKYFIQTALRHAIEEADGDDYVAIHAETMQRAIEIMYHQTRRCKFANVKRHLYDNI